MGFQEDKVSQSVRLRASDWGIWLLRNNNGMLPTKRGGMMRFGLGNESETLSRELKSSDYVGITPIIITPDMVGKTVGVFTAIETKANGFKIKNEWRENSREWGQQNFIDLVIRNGGIAGFATSNSDFDSIIRDCAFKLGKTFE